jgi:hypothetical protein
MTLQDLPVEIICMIIRFVGSNQLRKQEACCLTVCKWWYQIVTPILLEDLQLSAIQLVQAPDHVFPKLRAFLRRLSIDTPGPNDWPTKRTVAKWNGG